VDAYPYAFNTVYQGNATKYDDSLLGAEGTLYVYRLSKRRGQKVFSTSSLADLWSLGINTSVGMDPFEPNDLPEKATSMEIDRIASCYYYESTSGDMIQDVDWYKVTIPANKIAELVIRDLLASTTTSVGTHFLCQIPDGGGSGSSVFNVFQDVVFRIYNTTNAQKEYLFRIFPDPVPCIGNLGVPGGMIIGYRISLSKITAN
jgi:hypothetical protein